MVLDLEMDLAVLQVLEKYTGDPSTMELTVLQKVQVQVQVQELLDVLVVDLKDLAVHVWKLEKVWVDCFFWL